jgi:branched-chain amino acid transport system ATP-binding protein
VTDPAANLLEVRNVTKAFGSLVAVRDVSLGVPPGELHAVIGPNGAGKTTFFNLISGFFAPSAGHIVFEGRDVTALPPHRRVALGMARTFQITEIFPELPVRENVRIAAEVAAGYRLRPWLGREARSRVDAQVQAVLALAGLESKAGRLVGELAHGDQRAAEIAMALALKPRLLLLDEPTAGMGDQETYEVTALIRRLHRDSRYTIVLIEHDMRVVFHLADRVTVLDQGRLLAQGTPAEIAADDAVQAAYLGKAA